MIFILLESDFTNELKMKIYYLFLKLLLYACFFLGGCVSSTSYKSATVEEGKGFFGPTAGWTTLNYPNDFNSISSTKSRIWPTVEFFVQYGLSDSFELGMTTNFIGLIGDVKFQFFDGKV